MCALGARIRKPDLAEGSALARRKGFPAVFRAALVQTFASLVLSVPAFGFLSKHGRYPSPCALPPRLRQEAFGM
jgi:hypothetical protein